MKKILLISHSPLVTGGAEKCLIEYAEVLIAKGHSCVVLLPTKGGLSKELTQRGIEWEAAGYTWATKPVHKSFERQLVKAAGSSIANVFKVVKKHKPDMIMINTVVIPWGLYIGRALNIPTVLLVHETLKGSRVLDMEPSYEQYVDVLDKNTDYVIYNSQFTKDNFGDDLKTPVIAKDILYPVPDIEDHIDTLYKKNQIKDHLRIAIIGSVQERKNQIEAIEAAKILRQQGVDNFVMNLYGDGDVAYLTKVEAAIKKHRLEDHVKIQGYVDNIYELINAHEVVLSPFLHEPFGRAVLEGQLFGRVVIANDTGAGPELVNDMVNGLMYTSGDPSMMADKIKWILDNKEKALVMGVYARDEQRAKYLSNHRYDALTNAVKYLSEAKDGKDTINLFDPIVSLSEYATGLEHMYRHIHKITHNRVTRTVLHRARQAARTVYHRIK